jgi:hypothetical protein
MRRPYTIGSIVVVGLGLLFVILYSACSKPKLPGTVQNLRRADVRN